MRTEIDSQLQFTRSLQIQLVPSKVLVEHPFDVREFEVDALNDCLSRVPRIEQAICCNLGEQVECGRRKVLDLVNEHIVDLRSVISVFPDLSEVVVHNGHEVKVMALLYPFLVKLEYLVHSFLLFLFGVKSVSAFLNVHHFV